MNNAFDVSLIVFLCVRNKLLCDQVLNTILILKVELRGCLAEFVLNVALILKHLELVRGEQVVGGGSRRFVCAH